MSLQGFGIPNEQEIMPYFQPIVSLQTQNIIGYEALGRKINGNHVQSLGPFFKNPEIDDETHIKVDRFLREIAIQKISQTSDDTLLFINLKPSWIYRHKRTDELPTLQLLSKYNIPASRVVIEITEEEFTGDLEYLTEIIQLYRKVGCKIAVDDVGSGSSNFDRIAFIQPQILKIDLNILKRSSTHVGYKALLRSFSILSAQIGASLLIEGVETKQDIHSALEVGARYVQGFLFSEAVPEFLPSTIFSNIMMEEINLFGNIKYRIYDHMHLTEQHMNTLLETFNNAAGMDCADEMIKKLTLLVGRNCIRIYICLEDGSQISSNHYQTAAGIWEKDANFLNTNWIWRPYFIPNILLMKYHRRGILSPEYTDLDSSSMINTFSYPLDDGYFVFLDLIMD